MSGGSILEFFWCKHRDLLQHICQEPTTCKVWKQEHLMQHLLMLCNGHRYKSLEISEIFVMPCEGDVTESSPYNCLLLPALQPGKLLGTKADNSYTEPKFCISQCKECSAEGALLCVADVARVSNYFLYAMYTFTSQTFPHTVLKLKWWFLMLGSCLMKIPQFRLCLETLRNNDVE